ncbi:biotin--[acetyl-CoA-carboxylase] ligase [Lactovum miscens]|uniref:biotin--[biotin carboxyl-carrier protein] ligase n=1 Tax=Lactovum miscens TaxID=190387 RepID=A0A841CBK7_9LACT|nr:biotin--[acetyl-CoA-carboxylase] ligase [Lactovum miscens]MBB5888769.1 BirA family biotin operon repressor/biotin-[acetyl-CoA-carboxylase] ligase [Lactovum miscens]
MTFFDKAQILEHNQWLEDLVLLDTTPSTQLEARGGLANTLYLTDHQTATYGRFGRKYYAANTGGIYMSANLGQSNYEKHVQYTILAASAVVSAIEKLTTKKPTIKWVNDVYLGKKKIVGILAESGPSGMILGMGINFDIQYFPEELSDRATSLYPNQEYPSITESDLISKIWSEFRRLENLNYLEIYKSHCFVLGMTVSFKQNNHDLQGVAIDLTPQGELIVNCNDGIQRILNSGEISLKKWTE